MTFSEVLANEVLELRAERNRLREELRRVRQSRDLWRYRAITGDGRSIAVATALRPRDERGQRLVAR